VIANRSALWRYVVRIARIVLIGCLLLSTYRHASGLVSQAQGRDHLRDALVLPAPEPEEPQEESPAVWPPYAPAMAPELSRATLESWNCDYPPPLPAAFWGAVTLNGENVPAGTPITAWIDGVQVASTASQIHAGASVYNIDIPADDPCTPGRQGGNDGETVRFKVEDSWARDLGDWESGSVNSLDLNAGGAVAKSDLDGDDKTDLIVWRPSNGTWYGLLSSKGYSTATPFMRTWGSGARGDVPIAGDLDGDGKMDLIVWRPSNGTWYGLLSSKGYNTSTPFMRTWGSGANDDVPIAGDLDGDGKMDLIVWRPSNGTWYGLLSSKGYSTAAAFMKTWGSATHGDLLISGR
jgi:hypothetical protein